MKAVSVVVLQVLGGLFVIAAFLQWITFDYPDVNPFAPGAIFAPGMLSQLFNWILVCFLGTIGVLLISFARSWRQKH